MTLSDIDRSSCSPKYGTLSNRCTFGAPRNNSSQPTLLHTHRIIAHSTRPVHARAHVDARVHAHTHTCPNCTGSEHGARLHYVHVPRLHAWEQGSTRLHVICLVIASTRDCPRCERSGVSCAPELQPTPRRDRPSRSRHAAAAVLLLAPCDLYLTLEYRTLKGWDAGHWRATRGFSRAQEC